MEINFEPFPRQYEAVQLLMDNLTNEVLYGGGSRGGKSYLGNVWIIMEALAKPGSTWLIARKRFSDLRDTTLITFHQVLEDFNVPHLVHYNAQQKRATFVNGSIVFFKDIDYEPSDPMYNRIGSYNLTGSFLDEAQEINARAISVLKGRYSNLTGDGWNTIPKSLYTCNPDKGWVYSDFYRPWKDSKLDKTKAFVPALATDNPYISIEYIQNLERADKVTKERLLYGNFEYDDDPAVLIEFDAIQDMFTAELSPKTFSKSNRYITCDVARFGDDKTVIAVWDGLQVIHLEEYGKSSMTMVSDKIIAAEKKYNVPRSHVWIDEDGVGGGVVDILRGCKGFVNNSRALNGENYNNLKSQCAYMLAKKINAREVGISCDIIEITQAITEELEQLKAKDVDKDGKLAIQPKEKVKIMLGRSPDYADTLIMRMAVEMTPTPMVYV